MNELLMRPSNVKNLMLQFRVMIIAEQHASNDRTTIDYHLINFHLAKLRHVIHYETTGGTEKNLAPKQHLRLAGTR
uniref:Uncharacterized protein n=1 Tax=Romanomermis culicivorax TaxID=13658 RepID=A0A915I1N0_ROMCU